MLFKLLQCLLLCAIGAGAALALDCMDCAAMAALRDRVSQGVDPGEVRHRASAHGKRSPGLTRRVVRGGTLSAREHICAPVSHVGACRAWRSILKVANDAVPCARFAKAGADRARGAARAPTS
eukprot:3000267-Rhodomonas_salina.1